ncbi:MAG: histidine phosphatase family protein [archaeon]
MKIILLRHSESISNKEDKADSQIDSGLTVKGKKDANELISKLKKLKMDLFIVSPLKRNLQTIQPFLETINKPKVIISELTLERNLGDFTGSEMGAFQKYCDENKLDKVFYRPKNGESIADTYERAKKFLKSLKKYSDKKILVCGHKNFLMCLEILIKNEDIKDYYNFIPLKNSEIREFNVKI